MSQSRGDKRRNATGHLIAGSALTATSAAANSVVDSKLERSGKPKIFRAAAQRKLSPDHAKWVAGKAGVYATRMTGIPLMAYGGYNLAKPDSKRYVRELNVKRDVLSPLEGHLTLRSEAHTAGRRVNKRDSRLLTADDQKKLIRRKKTGRHLSELGGTLGLSALALRTPELAGMAIRRVPRLKGNARLVTLASKEPMVTRTSNTLGIAAIGSGSVGSFNYASQQKLEQAQQQAMAKALPKFKWVNGERVRITGIHQPSGRLTAVNSADETVFASPPRKGPRKAPPADPPNDAYKQAKEGLGKSYVTGIGWKPITQMKRKEVDALRAARNTRRQGGRGHMGQLIGGEGRPRVTPEDAARGKSAQAHINANREALNRARLSPGYDVTDRKLHGGTVSVIRRLSGSSAPRITKLGEGSWAGITGGTKRNKGVVHIDPESHPNFAEKDIIRHEMLGHANVRNRNSAFLRTANDPRKWLGDEARSVRRQSAGSQQNTLYHSASFTPKHGRIPLIGRPKPEGAASRQRLSGMVAARGGDQKVADEAMDRFKDVYTRIGQAQNLRQPGGVTKADRFLSQHAQNISPSAEEGYKTLKRSRNREAGMAAGNAVVGGFVGAEALRHIKLRKPAIGTGVMASWTGLQGMQTAYNAQNARSLQRRIDKIKAKGMERAAAGELGPNREPASKSLVNVPGKGNMMLPASQVPKKWLRRAPKHKSLVGMTDADRTHGELMQSSFNGARQAVATREPINGFFGPRVMPKKEKVVNGRTIHHARSRMMAGGGTVPVPTAGKGQKAAGYLMMSPSKDPLFTPKGTAKEIRRHETAHTKHRKPLSTYVRHTRNPRALMGEEARADSAMRPRFRERSTYNIAATGANGESQAHNAYLLRTTTNLSPALSSTKASDLKRYNDVSRTLQEKGIAKGLLRIPRVNYGRAIGAGLSNRRPRTGGIRRYASGTTATFRGSVK